MSEKDLTVKELLNDEEFVSTLVNHSKDRYGKTPKSKQEAFNTFLDDYRAIQSNTYSAIKFRNYVQNMEDQEQKQALGKLYNVFENKLENWGGEGGILGGVVDYIKYGIADPLNIFGLGAGKLISATAGKAVVGKLIRDAFIKNPKLTATGAGIAIESPLSAYGAYEVEKVKGPEGLGIQEDINKWNVGIGAIAGATLGGGAGYLGAKLGNSAVSNIEKIKADMLAAREANLENSIQGQAAKAKNMAERKQELLKPDTEGDEFDIIGSYVEVFDSVTPDKLDPDDIKISYPRGMQGPKLTYRNVELDIGDSFNIISQTNKKGKVTGYKVGTEQFTKKTDAKNYIAEQINDAVSTDPSKIGITDSVITKTIVTPQDYTKFGRIIDFDEDIAKVEYLPTTYKNTVNPNTQKYDEKLVKDINLKELRGVSEKRKQEFIDDYLETYDKFFDKVGIEEGKVFLKSQKLSNKEIDEVFDSALSEESLGRLINFTFDAGMSIQNYIPERKLAKRVNVILDDPSKRMTEKIGDLIELVDQNKDLLGEVIPQALAKNGLTAKQVSNLVRAEASIIGSKFQNISAKSKMLGKDKEIADQSDRIVNEILRVEKGLTDSQKANVARLQKEAELERAAAKKFGVGVDVWRSYLVSQPATTMRNIIGSALRVPGETLESATRRFQQKIEAEILGVEPPKEIVGQEIGLLAKNLLRPLESVELARIFAEKFTEADRRIFKVFDDYFSNSLENETQAGVVLKSLHKGSQYVNVLNRMQDRTIKSAGFLTELDNQLKQAINRGEIDAASLAIKGSDGKVRGQIRGIRELIANDKLDLINDEMVNEALKFAYKLTYQNRRAGDDLIIGGDFINSTQAWLNRNPGIKILLPFPNFMVNALVYNLNRVVGLGILKSVIAGSKVGTFKFKGGAEASKKRRRIIQGLEKRIKEFKDIKGREDPQLAKRQLKALEEKLAGHRAIQSGNLRNVEQLRQGIKEMTETLSFVALGWGIRETVGGSRYNEIKIGKETYNLQPLFPLTPFLWIGEAIRRYLNNEEILESRFMSEGFEAITGLQADRSGTAARTISKIIKEAQYASESGDTTRASQAIGEILGGLIGYAIMGYATPFKTVDDLFTTIGDAEDRRYTERKLQTVFDPLSQSNNEFVEAFKAGANEFLRSVFSGSRLEKAVFNTNFPRLSGSSTSQKFKKVPIVKNIGVSEIQQRDEVEDELERIDYPIWRINPRTGIKEYDYIYKITQGQVADRIVKPNTVDDPFYRELSKSEQRKKMRSLFSGSGTDRTKREKKAFRDAGFSNFNNIREVTNVIMEANYPSLVAIKKFYGLGRRVASGALKEFREKEGYLPNLKYIGNVNDTDLNPEEMANVKKQLADIKKLVSYAKSEDKSSSRIVSQGAKALGINKKDLDPETQGRKFQFPKATGGYIGQMKELGF